MSKITTTEKGDLFEDQVYNIFKDLLISDKFVVSGKRSSIYRKREYYSKDRGGNIITDISIETFIENADKYSILTILECKNLSTPVPVDDIEEFDSKLRQIGEHNLKGIMISCSGFQKSALNIAKSKGIMLINIKHDNTIEYINYRKDRKPFIIGDELIEQRLLSIDFLDNNFFGLINNKPFDNLPSALIELGIIDFFTNIPKYINVPYISDSIINKRVELSFNEKFYDSGEFNFEKACDLLRDDYKVDFCFDKTLNNEILGKINFDPLKIEISSSLVKNDHRWRFTMAHEIGHLILHKNLLQDFIIEHYDSDDQMNFVFADSIQINKRLEIQANLFAGNLLIPIHPLIRIVEDFLKNENIYKGFIYWDHQPGNYQRAMRILKNTQDMFNVSIDAAKYRLVSLGLLINETDNSIKNISRRQK